MPISQVKRRKITGTKQLPEGWEIIDIQTWAFRNGYSHRHSRKLAQFKRIRYAFKSAGKWYVPVPRRG